ncbi:MAG TPA: NAD(P)-binding domain-containing protein [Dongiaceae bacterium]|nr:NAD(P)-binding domain-containing protein [Dongiaceae bacterium]
MNTNELPVAIIGAGPIGLAAAANCAERRIPFRVYEAGATVGANLRDWGHVRIFTTWEQNLDPASRRLLEAGGWKTKSPGAYPTGDDLYRDYLKPLAELPALNGNVVTGAKIMRIARQGVDKVTSKGRESKPFELRIDTGNGKLRTELARAVIDASGTWQNANPLGGSGLEAEGEDEYRTHIVYGMPDVLGSQRKRYENKRVAVVGSGYSAIQSLLDLARLCQEAPKTQVTWIVRGKNMAKVYGGGENDQLPARGKLGTLLKPLVDQGRIRLVHGFSTRAVANGGDALTLSGATATGSQSIEGIDEIIACTGQRPDLAMTRELRVELDPWLESVKALGPLIDPNIHSCGSVEPHGHRETSHPEPGFYTIGVKSYGRAPTFLLLTGYEQARSVVAAIAGDMEAADNIQLVLPETGICETDFAEDGIPCCGTSSADKPIERAPIEIPVVAAKSGGCCGPRAQ